MAPEKPTLAQIVGEIDTREEAVDADDVAHLKDMASEAPVIRLVNLILGHALELRASDIHIEPFENRLILRYRVDGVLHEGESPPRRLSAAVISRIKIMANLDIAERRLPQDGRIRLRIEGRELDLRVSTVPTMHGESLVMRILDKGGVALAVRCAGLRAGHARALHRGAVAPARHPAGHRADRKRQDHHPVYGADHAEQAGREDPHGRRPGRISGRRHQSDSGQTRRSS